MKCSDVGGRAFFLMKWVAGFLATVIIAAPERANAGLWDWTAGWESLPAFDEIFDDDRKEIIGGDVVQKDDPVASTTVALLNGGALCTASILDTDIAITAAHCVEDQGTPMYLVFSSNAADRKAVRARVTRAVVPSTWGTVDGDAADWGDVAIMKFSGGLPAGFRKIDLLSSSAGLKTGGGVLLAGFGITRTHPHTGSGTLREVSVKIAKPSHGKSEIVFDQTRGRGACHGDSGGPAFVAENGKLVLMGLTSRGFQDPYDTCGRYAIYTKTTAYKSWISRAIAYVRR